MKRGAIINKKMYYAVAMILWLVAAVMKFIAKDIKIGVFYLFLAAVFAVVPKIKKKP